MQVFKFILLFLILGGSSYIGVLISKVYINRTEELKQIKTALNMLETKIKFTYEPLPEIFEQISNTLSSNIAEIFKNANNQMKTVSVKEAWKSSVDISKLNINKEDKKVLKELGNLLRANRYRWTG
ncbi:MAG: stage III sporulation protein AB [Clostridia bacterium]|nr:stage III sporulation protein AB [Clostridia bacterium]